MKKLITLTLKNLLLVTFSSFILYTFVCIFFEFSSDQMKKKIKEANPDGNFFRITYPNYSHLNKDYAYKIFEEWRAPKKEYKPFIGYRRQEFKGVTVNIDKFGIRKSINHQMNNSTWFFGGSTIWGTGADDNGTIPSHYAKITDSPVLNLGESGFNSFQESIYLQVLLTRGFKPKSVVFYDGVNDGYEYCQQDDFPQLRHAYTTRWVNMSKKLNELENKLSQTSIIELSIKKLKHFYFSQPLEYFSLAEKLEEAKTNRYKTNLSFNDFKPKKKYLFCDNEKVSNAAAKLTVNAWLNAALLLKSKGIPFWFVLQPTASYMPEQYSLDYLGNFVKQRIINEKASFEKNYDSLKKEFYSRCNKLNICEFFVDMTQELSEKNEPIFIDAYHISENGNKYVAKAMANIFEKK